MIMAKYIVEETNRSKYEKNYKFPMINLIPAIIKPLRNVEVEPGA